GKTVGTSSRDICPKGWRLPKVSATATTTSGSRDFTGDFAVLASSYNPNASWTNGTTANRYTSDDTIKNGMYLTAAANGNNYAGFSYSGYWNGASSSASNLGSNGYYWYSSVYDTNNGYYLYFLSSDVRPQANGSKYRGVAVRCVAQNSYTINYSSNGASSGSPSKTTEGTVYESGSVTTAAQGTMVKTGYNFLGWALTSGATAATYSAEASVSISDLLTAASAAGQTTTSGSTITLYPVWESVTYMQNVYANNLTESKTTTLVDSRDNQKYTVYRWPSTGTAGTDYPTGMAGYAIMTKDLSLGYVTGGSVTKGSDLTLTTSDSAAAGTISARTGTGNWSTTNSDSNLQYINGTGGTYDSHSYYSYGAAQLVCPKGWRPPTKTEYANIATFMGGNNSTGSSKIRRSPYNFVYGGYFYSSGLNKVGSYGHYWTSTQYSSTDGYDLSLDSSILTTGGSGAYKYLGMSVRCVAEYVTATMQGTSARSLTEAATTPLVDSRDTQVYTVYRWPSTGTAGTDYPTGMAGYAIMTKDLSLGYVTGGSITQGSDLTLTTDDSAAAGTISARTGTSDWSTTNSDDNLQYINGTGDTYDSHSYYSYGAAQAVCPKGWRPPTQTEYDNIATFMGGDNSTGSSKIRGTPYNFVYGGIFNSSGWNYVGSYGLYWASTQSSSTSGYSLRFLSSSLLAASYSKYGGRSVRCVAESTPDCSSTVHPTTTTGCKMKDGNTWILGYNGSSITWNNMFTGATNTNNHDATVNASYNGTTICPSGYSAPKITDYDTLIKAYGGTSYSGNRSGYREATGALYSVLGLSSVRFYWSSTKYSSSNAYGLSVDSSHSRSSYASSKTNSNYVLCYK
ncbi:hypothetical protein IJ103_03165, partial [Candidatus Saccharibacteria bacterium]|nr:hypothetical protein [Candidatus Saccharibacteria bacterium]